MVPCLLLLKYVKNIFIHTYSLAIKFTQKIFIKAVILILYRTTAEGGWTWTWCWRWHAAAKKVINYMISEKKNLSAFWAPFVHKEYIGGWRWELNLTGPPPWLPLLFGESVATDWPKPNNVCSLSRFLIPQRETPRSCFPPLFLLRATFFHSSLELPECQISPRRCSPISRFARKSAGDEQGEKIGVGKGTRVP
jgi:hypothetical protein